MLTRLRRLWFAALGFAAQKLGLGRLAKELAHTMFANQSLDARAQLGR